MKSRILDTSNSVYIENIPRLEWAKNTDISFIRSSQLTLNTLGENYSYEYLMGISGAAFRFHFNTDWCPSAGDVTTGFDVSKVLFSSLGYKYELVRIDDNSFEDIKSLYQRIIKQINQGIPIIAINLKEWGVWGIITGYLKNKPGILCRTYSDESNDYSLAEHAPWLSFFIGEKHKPLEENELVWNSLKIAVQLAKTNKFEEYLSGFHAFDYWIEELRKYSIPDNKKIFDEDEVHVLLIDCLLDARKAAVGYLTSMNKKLKKGSLIINNYKREVKLLQIARNSIIPSVQSKPESWTQEIIEKQIDTLINVLVIEKENIKLIEEELKRKSA